MHFTIKPVSFTCNLNCAYCFYLPKGEDMLKRGRMSDEVLEAFIKQYIQANDKHVYFTWQGGEPLLAGIDFYKKALAIQKRYSAGKVIENAIQTNATLINDEWCEFFKENKILLGVSIDGPQAMHDYYRKDLKGHGSFEQVMRGIELLKKHQVEFNTLTCINSSNARNPLEVYNFLKEIGSTFMQFSEVIETTPENCDFDHIPVSYQKKEFALNSEDYGYFMGEIFKEWVSKDIGKIVIRQFETMVARALGQPHITCVFENKCSDNFVIEANGDIYECDQAVYHKYRLTNILESKSLNKLHANRLTHHKKTLSKKCLECAYKELCNGGCVKHRINMVNGVPHTYFCEGYQAFFKTITPYLNAMVALENDRIPFTAVKQIAPQIRKAVEQSN